MALLTAGVAVAQAEAGREAGAGSVVPAGSDGSSGAAGEPTGRIEGWVVDEAGRPVDKSSVYATIGPPSTPGAGTETRCVWTKADGRFVLDGLPAGVVTFKVDAPGHYFEDPVSVELATGETVLALELPVESGCSVSGRVLGPSREPIPDARVSAEGHPAHAQSDENGRYRVSGLPPGPVALTVWARGRIGARETLDLDPGEEALDLVLETGVTVSGRVVRADGTPVEGCQVRFESDSWDESDQLRTGERMDTRADGSFDLVAVGDGSFRLVAFGPTRGVGDGAAWRYQLPDPVTVNGAPIEDLEVRLPQFATIRGRVLGLGPEDLSKLSMGVCEAEYYFPGFGVAVASDGTFESEELLPGRWVVFASLVDDPQRYESVEVEIVEGMTEVTTTLELDGPR